jgi:hypothetical protein
MVENEEVKSGKIGNVDLVNARQKKKTIRMEKVDSPIIQLTAPTKFVPSPTTKAPPWAVYK